MKERERTLTTNLNTKIQFDLSFLIDESSTALILIFRSASREFVWEIFLEIHVCVLDNKIRTFECDIDDLVFDSCDINFEIDDWFRNIDDRLEKLINNVCSRKRERQTKITFRFDDCDRCFKQLHIIEHVLEILSMF
jgi:hypothetical protein